MKIKKIVTFLLAALMLSATTGCKQNPGEGSNTETGSTVALKDESGKVIYKIIRPDASSDDIIEAAVRLKESLSEILGTEIEIETDFIKRGTDISTLTPLYEILVGNTNRSESENAMKDLTANQYKVESEGNKIIIAGYDDVSTVCAVDKFLSAFAKGDDGKFQTASSVPSAAFCSGTYNPADGPVNGRYYVKNLEGYYKTEGRTFSTENGLELLYTCASFEFNANCEGKVSLIMYAENVNGGNWSVFFTGYVDGIRCETRYAVSDNGETELVLAENLPAGDHTFELYRQTEWDRGDTYVKAVKLNGKITEKPADKDLYIEYIGDSLTSAFGNLDDIQVEGEWGGVPLFQDGTKSFGFITSKNLNADCSIVAIQGIGVVCGPQEIVMGDVYPKFPFVNDSDFTYSFDRKADIVVLNMGTNDYETMTAKGYTKKEVMTAMKELALLVREKNPGCKVVFVTGMQPSFTTDLKKLAVELGDETEGYYYLKLKQEMTGHEGHTSVAGHEMNAELLTEFLRGII